MTRAGSSMTCILLLALSAAAVDQDGLMRVDGKTLFPIGFYHFPEDDEAQVMVANGVNLFNCGNIVALDRAKRLGAYGWMPLPMHTALTPEHEARLAEAAKHPALAIWEGPDEMVWNFTAFSGLALDGIHEYRGAWWDQTPKAVAYAKEKAAEIMPNVHAWCAKIRELDGQKRPIWFNEAYKSDTFYVRQYLDSVDITGRDLYPVKAAGRPIANVASYTERFNQVGEGKPVYMVLQAFSWHEVKKEEDLPSAYPSFAESRFMAWDAIAHGARGILYWGSAYTENTAFLQSIYAVTRELGALQPFLTANEMDGVSVNLIEAPFPEPLRGVAHVARVNEGDGLLVLVNEDEVVHMDVEVNGLSALEGRELHMAYGEETLSVKGGRVLTRLQPLEVKVFTTTPDAAGTAREGRKFGIARE